MTERVEWLGTTWLAAGVTVLVFLLVLALAVVLTVGILGDSKELRPSSWRRSAEKPPRDRDVT